MTFVGVSPMLLVFIAKSLAHAQTLIPLFLFLSIIIKMIFVDAICIFFTNAFWTLLSTASLTLKLMLNSYVVQNYLFEYQGFKSSFV